MPPLLFLSPLIFFFLLLSLLSGSVSQVQKGLGVGINYGQIANNLPSPTRVASLLQSIQVNRVRLYDADPNVLRAFADSDVEFIVGLDESLYNLTNPDNARTWIQSHVQPYISHTKITCITVGNEVLTGDDDQSKSYLLPAMKNVYSALEDLGLTDQVTVTTAHSVGILGSSYPPSSGSFRPDLEEYLQPMLNFHSQIKSPFLINAYPFFSYKDNPNEVSLDYVLFRPNNSGMTDPYTGLHYDNMLYAQIDSVYSAIRQMGHTDIRIQISETGWPSKGDPDEIGASPENAAAYNGNLMRRVERQEGTPGRPIEPINVYVFALFNENLKPGPASERNYGLYYPNGNPVYNIGLQGYLPRFYTASTTQRLTLEWHTLVLLSTFLISLIIFTEDFCKFH